MFTKNQVIENLRKVIVSYEIIWKESGDVFWKNAVDDKKRELELTEALSDDDSFMHNRFNLLNQHGFFQKSLDQLDFVFPRIN